MGLKSSIGTEKLIKVEFDEGVVEYLNIWLRDNCQCSKCYDSNTYQRLIDTFDIPKDIHSIDSNVSNDSNLIINWSDGHSSTYTLNWLLNHTKKFTDPPIKKVLNSYPERVYWTNDLIKSELPLVDYDDVINKKSKDLYDNIYKYGFTFIENIPITAEDTEKMLNAMGNNIRYTHYGGFWDFTTDLAMKDTAYSEIEIPSHTDGTYWEYTPYLQLFHLLYHDGEGGNTTLVDGFNCAKQFKKEYPDYYEFLKHLKIECHSLGDVYLTQSKPIFIHDENDELIQISWNNSDRSTNFHLSNNDLEKFYDSIRAWNELIHRNEYVFEQRLVPGTAVIFDNWRVFHARIGTTTGKRRMCGAYFDRDDFYSFLTIQNSNDEQKLFNSL